MPDLGARLKSAREAHGISLRDIATRTKISVTALEALERNDFSRIPGGIFGRAFVRSYALEIGLDPDSTVVDFVSELDEQEREAAARGARSPEITPDDRVFLERQRQALRMLRWGLAVAALIVLLVVTWWFWSRRAKAAGAPEAAKTSSAAEWRMPAPSSGTSSRPAIIRLPSA